LNVEKTMHKLLHDAQRELPLALDCPREWQSKGTSCTCVGEREHAVPCVERSTMSIAE
jgi:hypothetical protein